MRRPGIARPGAALRGAALLFVLPLLALPLLGLAACSQPPPNIVLVVADDHGYPYAGFTGSHVVRTPNLDALAAEGTLFTRAFTTASSCRPSHRTLLTGLYPQQWLATARARPKQGPRERGWSEVRHFATLPGLLAAHGYATFQGGKLWEGRTFQDVGFSDGTKQPLPRSGRPDRRELTGGDGLDLGRETMEPLWEFLDAHRDVPFFVWFAPTLPHSPFDAGPAFAELYAETGGSAAARGYYANVSRLDAEVGQLVRRLDEAGLRERTLVVYLSDNGWQQDPAQLGADGGERGKHTIYEPGFRTPLVVSWPGRMPAGRVRDDLVSTVDLFPTLLDVAGIPTPPGRMGVSLLPTLLYGAPSPRTRIFAGVDRLRGPPPRGGEAREISATAHFVRTDDWRYVAYDLSGREELFRVSKDPGETEDLSERRPDQTAALRDELERWKQSVWVPLENEAPAPAPQSAP